MLNENDKYSFQFRRYREEVIRRRNCRAVSSQTQQIIDLDEIIIEETVVKHNKYDDDDDDEDSNMGGTVIQNLTDISIIIDRKGKVHINKKESSSSSSGFENNDDNSDDDDDDDDIKAIKRRQAQQQPLSVPAGTTLLLRNLRNCIVIIRPFQTTTISSSLLVFGCFICVFVIISKP
mmetsp:Transcript_18409/g.19851  ORF Transcript_18409/g.19851 Transcript_18409/m.19851 type:complete len:177 (+) Transcript_18409:41-571(+)